MMYKDNMNSDPFRAKPWLTQMSSTPTKLKRVNYILKHTRDHPSEVIPLVGTVQMGPTSDHKGIRTAKHIQLAG